MGFLFRKFVELNNRRVCKVKRMRENNTEEEIRTKARRTER